MTFEQEWAELRSTAARRSAMQINSAPAEGGGGGGAPDLVVNRDDLGAIGNDAYDLRDETHISNHLDYTKAQHAKGDVKIGGDLAPISKLSEYMK
ncbi:hypothetical protein ACFWEB_00025 [Streptomyces parvus]|uniref:hypothetical protein n=1 Tax=Streptomyces parvus TaxID=66428 RepID=UPI0035D9ADC5